MAVPEASVSGIDVPATVAVTAVGPRGGDSLRYVTVNVKSVDVVPDPGDTVPSDSVLAAPAGAGPTLIARSRRPTASVERSADRIHPAPARRSVDVLSMHCSDAAARIMPPRPARGIRGAGTEMTRVAGQTKLEP